MTGQEAIKICEASGIEFAKVDYGVWAWRTRSNDAGNLFSWNCVGNTRGTKRAAALDCVDYCGFGK
jgi:hypothetical protein